MNEKSFLEKYAEPPKGFGAKKSQSDKKQTEDIMDEKSFLETYAEPPKGFWAKKSQSDKKQTDAIMDEKSFLAKYAEPPKGFGARKSQSDKKQSEIQKKQEATQLHDTSVLLGKGLSPVEFNKMKHRFLQSNEALKKQLAEKIPDLPRNEKGTIDVDKCTTEQKQAIETTIKTFINKNPEYKQMLEGILQRKVSDNEIKRDAEGVSVSFPRAQWKHKKSSER